MRRPPPVFTRTDTLLPYTTLCRSYDVGPSLDPSEGSDGLVGGDGADQLAGAGLAHDAHDRGGCLRLVRKGDGDAAAADREVDPGAVRGDGDREGATGGAVGLRSECDGVVAVGEDQQLIAAAVVGDRLPDLRTISEEQHQLLDDGRSAPHDSAGDARDRHLDGCAGTLRSGGDAPGSTDDDLVLAGGDAGEGHASGVVRRVEPSGNPRVADEEPDAHGARGAGLDRKGTRLDSRH